MLIKRRTCTELAINAPPAPAATVTDLREHEMRRQLAGLGLCGDASWYGGWRWKATEDEEERGRDEAERRGGEIEVIFGILLLLP